MTDKVTFRWWVKHARHLELELNHAKKDAEWFKAAYNDAMVALADARSEINRLERENANGRI